MITKSQIKQISSYKINKYRNIDNVFVVEGEKMVIQAMSSNYDIINICATKQWIDNQDFNFINQYNLIEVSEDELKRLSSLTTPNNVLAVLKQKDITEIIPNNNLILMLDDINNPGNLGTIIRIAVWFGIKDIVCSNNTVDVFNPKTLQASMGAIFHANVMYCDIISFLEKNKEKNIYGTVLKGGKNIYEENLSCDGIIIIGNESHGIRDEVKPFINHPLTIPTFSSSKDVESLNASIATAIVVSEFKRRQ